MEPRDFFFLFVGFGGGLWGERVIGGGDVRGGRGFVVFNGECPGGETWNGDGSQVVGAELCFEEHEEALEALGGG